jgi:hypothetical protein
MPCSQTLNQSPIIATTIIASCIHRFNLTIIAYHFEFVYIQIADTLISSISLLVHSTRTSTATAMLYTGKMSI